MNKDLLDHCIKEINDLLDKGLIGPNKSPKSCFAFYVNNFVEIGQGIPLFIIKYNSLMYKISITLNERSIK